MIGCRLISLFPLLSVLWRISGKVKGFMASLCTNRGTCVKPDEPIDSRCVSQLINMKWWRRRVAMQSELLCFSFPSSSTEGRPLPAGELLRQRAAGVAVQRLAVGRGSICLPALHGPPAGGLRRHHRPEYGRQTRTHIHTDASTCTERRWGAALARWHLDCEWGAAACRATSQTAQSEIFPRKDPQLQGRNQGDRWLLKVSCYSRLSFHPGLQWSRVAQLVIQSGGYMLHLYTGYQKQVFTERGG